MNQQRVSNGMKVFTKYGNLCIKLSKLEQLFAVKRSFCVEAASVTDIQLTKPDFSLWEFRAPGLHLPYVIKTGTYYTLRGKEFWYIRRHEQAVTIELKNEQYTRLILSFSKAEKIVGELRRELGLEPTNSLQ